ncbi:MAG: flagellar hook-associated protein FlgK [Steroidobacteraceae bacterium]
MPDILSTGVSGLLAFQRALDVTSHNIANATTPGYSRQRAELGTRVPQSYGSSYVGSGVQVNAITRSWDQLLATQLTTAKSTQSQLETFAGKAAKLSNLFADSSTGLSASMQKFINAVQGVSNDPTSTAARQVMLSEAESLRQRLQTYDGRLGDIDTEINAQLAAEASAVTSAASQIAKLNAQIVAARTSGGMPNDLLDARDQLISDLSARVSVTTVTQDDGAVNVFIGNGQALVLGPNATRLVTQPDSFDPTRLTIAYQAGSSTVDMSAALSGGSLGGLLQFRREMLDPARNDLGQIAVALADVANSQHRAGQDLNGNPGGDLFAVGGVQVLPERANAGGAALAVARADVGKLTGDDYILSFDGSTWTARNAVTGVVATTSGDGSVGSPLEFDGLSVVVGGTPGPATGDRFLLRPTAGAIRGFSVAVTDPARVAAAAPIRTSAAAANTGSGTISAGSVLDAADGQLRSRVDIQFTSATQYTMDGVSYTYTPGEAIEHNGWSVAISGQPQAGDVFTVADNAGGVGDNRNALQLAQVLGRGVLSGGAESINGAISRLVGGIGVATSQAQSGAAAQGVIVDDIQSSIDGVSGVNLDEEAANMLRYQQAYQAAAQIIRITQTLFDTLIGATGR